MLSPNHEVRHLLCGLMQLYTAQDARRGSSLAAMLSGFRCWIRRDFAPRASPLRLQRFPAPLAAGSTTA